MKIGAHVQGGGVANVTSISAGQTIDSVTIGGSFIGGTANFSGAIAAFNIGPVKIGGDMTGGNGDSAGSIISAGDLPSITIGGSLAGAGLYTIGGVVYAIRRPDPFPSVFGYHEVFHLLVIAGAAAFGAVIWIWVIPVAGR